MKNLNPSDNCIPTPTGHITIFTDGGSRGNPGDAAIGVVIYNSTQMLWQRGKYIGHTTNNEAEYQAVTEALEWLIDYIRSGKNGYETVDFYLDSLLVVQQMSGKWQIKEPRMRTFWQTNKDLIAQLPYNVTFNHIPREKNTVADRLVNEALDQKQHNSSN